MSLATSSRALRKQGMADRFLLYMLGATVAVACVAFLRLSGLWEYKAVAYAVALVFGMGASIIFSLDSLGLMCIALAFMPFTEGMLRFEVGVITFSPFTLGMILLAFKGLLLVSSGLRRYRIILLDWIIIGLCALHLPLTLLSDDIMGSGLRGFHALFVPACAYFSIRVFADDARKQRMCLTALAAGIAAFSVVALAHFAIVQQRIQLLGTYPVSIATMTLIPIVLALFSDTHGRRFRILTGSTSMGAFLVTLSRMYLLCFLLSPLLLALVRRGKATVFAAFFLLATLGLFVSLTMSVPEEVGRFVKETGVIPATDADAAAKESGTGRLTDPGHFLRSWQMRLMAYRAGLLHFEENPVAGRGMHVGKQLVAQHNLHIQALETGGVLGWGLVAALFLALLHHIGPLCRTDGQSRAWAMLTLFILFNSMTNGLMHGLFPYVHFMAMGFACARVQILAQPASGEAG